MDRGQIGHPIWDTKRDQVAELVKRAGPGCRPSVAEWDKVADVAWQTDLSATRRHLAGYGRSLFRWFNRDYREAVATLKGDPQGGAATGS